ncbi:GGDEF domain-containing protein [Thiorhodococcus minor]|uniref:diguanylate cyclase n=1 Tax=Thiorhodococcus minor TaxID=57489 RepID=A0A6M0K4C0_9GAMM|nr:GGDEF domain-containing protein [Thiorhodococcus minor]NEV64580.1 GGDEF domain-containing protein [Thiorhodococcus minor]
MIQSRSHRYGAPRLRPSLTRVVLLIFGLTIGILSLAIYLASNALIDRVVRDQATKEARILSELVFAGLYGSMRAGWSPSEIGAVVARARSGVEGAEIDLVRSEHVAALFGDTAQARRLRQTSPEIARVLSSGKEEVWEDSETVHLVYPFVAAAECLGCHTNVAAGQVNGVVQMALPLAPLKRPLSAAFSGVIQVVAVVTLLLLSVQFLINRRFLVRPLMQLTSRILHVQRTGTLAHRKPAVDEPLMFLELQLLAQSFDALLEKLSLAQDQLREQSERDDLTGLLNRRAFNHCIALELTRAKRYARSLVLFVLDLDDFKIINDSYGHAAGDAVLCRCAELLEENLRENDSIARIGGDELVILAPEMDQKGAVAFKGKLRQLLEQTEILHEGSSLRVSASVGMALFPWDGETPQRLLRRADASMYEEKRQKKLEPGAGTP